MKMLNMLRDVFERKTGQSRSTPTHTSRLTLEDAINILSSARRRHVIDHLHTIDSEISIRELSEHLAELEDTDRKTTYIALYQQHLDKMADKDVITYNKRRGEIAPGPHCDVLQQIIEHLQQKLE